MCDSRSRSPVARVPWEKVRLGELVLNHQSGVYKHRSQYGEGRNIVGVSDLFRHDRIHGQSFRRVRLSAAEVTRFGLQVGDLVYAESSLVLEGIAKTLHVAENGEGTVFAWHTRRLRPKLSRVCPAYLSLSLASEGSRRFVITRATQTALTGIPVAAYLKTPVYLPPLPEQRRIAEILDTLDEAIRKTEQVISKLQQVKQGLLHDLLTRGIDEHGELRDPERHPEQFKDSPLGWIPRGWEVVPLGGLLDSVIDFRGRTPRKLGMQWGGGAIPALSAKNVRQGGIDLSLETYYGSVALYGRWMTRGDASKGDVLITMEAPLGNIAQIPDERRYILSQRVVLLKYRSAAASPDFMAVQMRAGPFQANLRRWSTGTTATGIQRAKLVKVPVVVPPSQEQQHIACRVQALEARLVDESSGAAKLRTLKQGLMDDLLTGRVRVPITAEEQSA